MEIKPRSPSLRGLMDFFGLVSTGSLADEQHRCGGLAPHRPTVIYTMRGNAFEARGGQLQADLSVP